MKIPFIKLHGAKNDFLVTPAAELPITDLQKLAIAICNRYTGVGADGWMILDRTEGAEYDATIRLFNSDGSEPEVSGNGTRCAALLLALDKLAPDKLAPDKLAPDKPGDDATGKNDLIRIRTGAGVRALRSVAGNAASKNRDPEYLFEMNMGDVRVLELHAKVQGHNGVILNVGNPQCAIPVDDFDFDWRSDGAAIERDPRFPNRTNVSFIRQVDRHTIDVRFWERGAGETNSSGTGSTGAAMAAVARGFAESPVIVLTPAGPLQVRFEPEAWLTGPAQYVADGCFHYVKIAC